MSNQSDGPTTDDVTSRLAALPADDLTRRLAIVLAQVGEPLPLAALHLMLWRLGWSAPTASARRELAGAAARVRRQVGAQATEKDGELELELKPDAAQAVRSFVASLEGAEREQLEASWVELVLGYERLRKSEAAGLDPAERALDVVVRRGVAWLLAAKRFEVAARVLSDANFVLQRWQGDDSIRRDYRAVRDALVAGGDETAEALRQLAPFHELILRCPLGEDGATGFLQAAAAQAGPSSPLGRGARRWLEREGLAQWSLLATGAAPPSGLELVVRAADQSARVAVAADRRRAIVVTWEDKAPAVWDLVAGVLVGRLARDDDPWDAAPHAALTPDGRTAVLARGNNVEVWDVDTGTMRQVLEGHTEGVTCVAVDDAGARAVSAASETVRVWDLGSGRCEHEMKSHTDYVQQVAISGDGRWAVSTGDTARLWDLSDGSGRAAEGDDQHAFQSVATSADGRVIAGGSYDNSLCVWDGHTGRRRLVLYGHAGTVESVALTPDGRWAVAAANGELRLWELDGGRLAHVLSGPGEIERVALSPDGQRAVASYDDGLLRVWRFGEHSRYVGNLEKQRTNCLALSPDGTVGLAGTEGGALWLAHAHAGIREPLPSDYCFGVKQVRITDQGRRALAIGSIEPLRCYDLARASCERQIGVEDDHFIDFTPSGKRAAAYAWYEKITTGYDVATGERTVLRKGELDPQPHTAALLEQDGWRVLYDCYKNALEILDLETGEGGPRYRASESISIEDVAVSADGRFGAAATYDAKVLVWELARPTESKRVWEGHSDQVKAVAFDPAAERLASGGEDGTLRVWDVATGECLACWRGDAPVTSCVLTATRAGLGTSRGQTLFFDLVPPHGRLGEAEQSGLELSVQATSVSWHPARPLVAVGCVDGGVRILEWDETTGFVEIVRAIERLLPTDQALTEVRWSTDGRWVRAVGWDGQVATAGLGPDGSLAGDPGWQAPRTRSPDGARAVVLRGQEVAIVPADEQRAATTAAIGPTMHATVRGFLWQDTPATRAWLTTADDDDLSKQVLVVSALLHEAPSFGLLQDLLARLGTIPRGAGGGHRLRVALPPLASERPEWASQIDCVRVDQPLADHICGEADLASLRGRVEDMLAGLVDEPPSATERDAVVTRYARRWGGRHALAAGRADRAAAWLLEADGLARRLEATAAGELDELLRDVAAMRAACQEPAQLAKLERWQRVLWRHLHGVAGEPREVRVQRVLAVAGEDAAGHTPRLEPTPGSRETRRTSRVMVCRAHKGWITSIALSADGRRALTGGAKDERVGVWDLSAGVCERLLAGHHSMIEDVAISADGRLGITAGSGEVRAWDLDTGECLRIVGGWAQYAQSANCLAITPDGRRVLFGVWENKALVWDRDTNVVRELTGHAEPVVDVAMSPDGQRAISIGGKDSLWVWDLTTGTKQRAIAGAFESDSNSRIGLGAEGPAVAISDDELKRVDLETGEIAEGLGGSLHALCMAPSGLLAATLDDDGWVERWQLDADEPYSWIGVQHGARDVALSADGHYAATANEDGSITVFDLEVEPGEPPADDPFNRIALCQNGRFAVSGGGAHELVLWDAVTGERQAVAGPDGAVWAVALTEDGRTALSAGNDNDVRCWQLATEPLGDEAPDLSALADHAECQHVLKGHTGAVRSLAISADGTRGISGSKDGLAIYWDLATGRALHRWSDHEGEVNGVALSPDGRLALSGADDYSVRVWEVSDRSASLRHVLTGHGGYVWALDLDPTGQRVASSSNDETVRIWDLTTGRCEHVLRGHEQMPQFVGWVDERFLVAACKMGIVRLWDARKGQLAATWLSETSIETGYVQGTLIALGLGSGQVELLRAIL